MDTFIVNKAVSTTPVLLRSAEARSSIAIYNYGSQIVWLANSASACSANGANAFPLSPGVTVQNSSVNSWYAVCGTGLSSSVAVMGEI